jgi:flagellar basal-body rod protein FlgG
MLEGLYSAAAGLMAQQRRMDAVANDLANVNTTGYKHVRVAFRDLAYQDPAQGARAGVQTGSGVDAWAMGRAYSQGALRRTDNPLDVAIEGPGWFRVRTEDGREGLTRDGAFHLNPAGELTTSTGLRLVPPITVPRGMQGEDVRIGRDGTVAVAAGRAVGRIQLVDVPAPDGLIPVGNNVFLPSAASGPVRGAQGAALIQGTLEGSNVDMADAMVDMMDAQKSFSLASQAVKMHDRAMEIANGLKR